jgi:hypothetical protein
VGFAIRVDKGNNTKAAFDKKLMEGLTFIQQYVDKRACFLPHEKDKKLEPIRSKMSYQVMGCCKPSDQPRDAARREECSNWMKRV